MRSFSTKTKPSFWGSFLLWVTVSTDRWRFCSSDKIYWNSFFHMHRFKEYTNVWTSRIWGTRNAFMRTYDVSCSTDSPDWQVLVGDLNLILSYRALCRITDHNCSQYLYHIFICLSGIKWMIESEFSPMRRRGKYKTSERKK